MAKESVVALREKFVKEYEDNKDLYEEEDLRRVMEKDFYVERFVNFLGQGVNKGFEQMKECFKWRKAYGINHFQPNDYPEEFFESGSIFPLREDKEGTLVVHFRPKFYSKQPKDKRALFEKYFFHVVNSVDEKAGREFGWGLVMDCTEIGVADADLGVIFSLLPQFRKYFPNGSKYCVIYGLHWSVNFICKMALAAMPADSAKKIKLYNLPQVHQLIAVDNLPDYLSGTATDNYCQLPDSLLKTL